MKVNNTINASNTNLAAITNKQPAAETAKNKAGKIHFGRFDTFTKVEEHEKKTECSAEDDQLIKNLDRLSEEEKADVAFSSYLEMRKCLRLAADYKTRQIDTYGNLQEEKAYYTSLMSENGKITGDYGKYAFAAKHGGNYVSKSDVESALAEVQRRLDSLVNPERGVGNDLHARIFQISSNVFQAVTGITDDVLNLADESLWKLPDGLTHENFLDTVSENLKSVQKRSDQLQDLMNDYINGNKYAQEIAKKGVPEPADKDRAHLLNTLEKYFDQLVDVLPFKLNLFVNPTPKTNWDEVAMKLPQD